jgi:hypothetical protein
VKWIIGLLLLVMASSAFAQQFEVFDIDKFPGGPPPLVRKVLASPVLGSDGFSFVIGDPEMVRRFSDGLVDVRAHVEGRDSGHGAGKYYADISAIRLPFVPARFEPGKLIGAWVPDRDPRSMTESGLMRYWEVADAGQACLFETDFANHPFKYPTHKTLLNAKVNDEPASSIVVAGDRGALVEMVTWFSGGRMFFLFYLPRLENGTRVAPDVSAYTLAQRVR